MFEHVGRPHYRRFFSRLGNLLADDGVALVHTIGRQTPPQPINVWMRQNIFPGAYLPGLSQLSTVLEKQDYWLADFENLRLHYATTLKEWNRRFQLNRERVKQLDPDRYDDRFCRMWEFYLQACEAGFRHSGLTVFQLQLTKTIDVLPITRDYMFARGAPPDGGRGRCAGADRAWPASRLNDSQPQAKSCPRVHNEDGGTCGVATVRRDSHYGLAHDRNSTPQAPRRRPGYRLARCAAVPRRAPQPRGRAGPARRDPRQQRGARPRLAFPGAAAFLRSAAPADL